jgi:hypothetical protein
MFGSTLAAGPIMVTRTDTMATTIIVVVCIGTAIIATGAGTTIRYTSFRDIGGEGKPDD